MRASAVAVSSSVMSSSEQIVCMYGLSTFIEVYEQNWSDRKSGLQISDTFVAKIKIIKYAKNDKSLFSAVPH